MNHAEKNNPAVWLPGCMVWSGIPISIAGDGIKTPSKFKLAAIEPTRLAVGFEPYGDVA